MLILFNRLTNLKYVSKFIKEQNCKSIEELQI